MRFRDSKYDDKVAGKLPEWKASDGMLREKVVDKEAQKRKTGAETLKGYVPTEGEQKGKKAPKKIMDIENSYGTFSVGVDNKKQMVTLTTQHRHRDPGVMRSESKELKGASSVNLQKVPGNARINSSRKQESAVEYRNDAHRQVPFLLDRMRKFSDQHQLDVQEEIIPFLSVRDEKKQMRELRNTRKQLQKEYGNEEQKSEVESQIEYLESVVRDKEQELQRTRRRLLSVRKAALEQNTDDYTNRLLSLWQQMEEETKEGGGDEDEAESKNASKKMMK